MSDIFYGKKTIQEIDTYYGITNNNQQWKLKDCEIIQQGFSNHGILLSLRECEDLYSIYSEEYFCAGWECMDGFSEEDIFNILKPVLCRVISDRIDRITILADQIEQYDTNNVDKMEYNIAEVINNSNSQ